MRQVVKQAVYIVAIRNSLEETESENSAPLTFFGRPEKSLQKDGYLITRLSNLLRLYLRYRNKHITGILRLFSQNRG